MRDAHKQMRRYNDTLKDFEAHFEERPCKAAEALLGVLPTHLETWRQYAYSRFGIDLDDREQRKNLRWTNVADAFEYTLLAIKYDAFDNALLCMIFFADSGERGERLARLVCASFLLALRNMPGMMAATIETFQKAAPRLANETGLIEFLAGYLVTHTSVHRNLRLRAGIDERREEGESRYARLLKELPAEAFAAYKERSPTWGDLMDLRSEAARRLEKRGASPKKAEAVEYAQFADRETALKLGRDVGLSPKEYEIFKVFVENPGIKYREVADKLGVSIGTISKTKSRIKKALAQTG
jgi:DNA-binding CsgD family transcriptional regulator